MNKEVSSTTFTDPVRLIQEKKFAEVIEILKNNNDGELNAESLSLLGLAYFHQEQYFLAVNAYEKAVKINPSQEQWKEMLQKAKANYISEVNVPVPEIYHFERNKLLVKPVIPENSFPEEPKTLPRRRNLLKKIRLILGKSLGSGSTSAMNSATKSWGKIAGYKGKIWTNWYRKPGMLGILTLAYMR